MPAVCLARRANGLERLRQRERLAAEQARSLRRVALNAARLGARGDWATNAANLYEVLGAAVADPA
jgi:hypothetical protein